MNIIKKYTNVNIMIRIIIGLIIGVTVGILLNWTKPMLSQNPSDSAFNVAWVSVDTFFNIIGNLFIGAMRGVAPILIFFMMTSSLMRSKSASGQIIKKQILLYLCGTVCASLVAVFINFIFKPTIVLPNDVSAASAAQTGQSSDMILQIFKNLVANPVDAIANANFISILFWSVLFGIAARMIANQSIVRFFEAMANILTNIVKGVIQFAPFGISGLIYIALVENGIEVYATYAELLLVYLLITISMFLVVNPFLVFLTLKRNPYPLVFRAIKEVGISAFFLRSSAANIPINLKFCKTLQLDKDNYQVSIPLGLSLNMEGAAITIITLTLATCTMQGIDVQIGPAIILSVVAVVSALGSAGVAGGSILLVPMACSLFGIGSEISTGVVAVGFIIGVVQDSVETALNSSTDGLFTATVQLRDKIKKGVPYHKIVGGTLDDAIIDTTNDK